jgi:tellurite resistance protein TerC
VLAVTVAGWGVTLAVIVSLLALDWLFLGRRSESVGLRTAAWWSLFYVLVSVLFGVVFALLNGWDVGAQFFAGYVVEKSLSVDNLFVFVIIIGAFAVPVAQQPKALTVGIIVALVLRAVFIGVGAALLELFTFMFLVFGLVLVVTAVQLFRHRNEDPDVEESVVVGLARRALPMTSSYDGGRIITRRRGRRVLTPMFLALLAIGSTDVMFAFDSIPAVFGVTDHAYIVLVVNAFALLGLRPLFFLVSGLLDRLVYMSAGLAVILAFIGVKLVLEFAHHEDHVVPEISTAVSLGVIVTVLAITTIASLLQARRQPTAQAHAGSIRPRDRRRRDDTAPGLAEGP